MESMKILNVSLSGSAATPTAEIHVISTKTINGKPEALINIHVQLDPQRATKAEAKDVALKYLDPA
jgi:hypothetical protein